MKINRRDFVKILPAGAMLPIPFLTSLGTSSLPSALEGATDSSLLKEKIDEIYDKAIVTNASREAAREWIEYTDRKDPDRRQNVLDGIVQSYIQGLLISFDDDSDALSTSYRIDSGSGFVDATGATHVYNTSNLLEVEVAYRYDFLVLPGFIEGFVPALTLRAVTVMRAE